MRSIVIAGLTAALGVTGCSSSTHPAAHKAQPSTSVASAPAVPSVSCPPSLRAVFSPGAPSAVSVQTDVSPGFSTCGYSTTAARPDKCTAATVTINTNPQALTDFHRWVDESAQNAVAGPNLAPIAVSGVGIEADWVPAILTFETATSVRWVAVRLTCPSATPQTVSLAKHLAAAALAAPSTR